MKTAFSTERGMIADPCRDLVAATRSLLHFLVKAGRYEVVASGRWRRRRSPHRTRSLFKQVKATMPIVDHGRKFSLRVSMYFPTQGHQALIEDRKSCKAAFVVKLSESTGVGRAA